jgi:hypothetical protein
MIDTIDRDNSRASPLFRQELREPKRVFSKLCRLIEKKIVTDRDLCFPQSSPEEPLSKLGEQVSP